MEKIWSKFQTNIFDFIENETGNLVIDSKAGSAKTSTIVKSLDFVPEEKRTLFLAFNRHIAKELKDKVPTHVHVYTCHGLGWAAIRRKFKDAELDEKKVTKVLYKKSAFWNLSDMPKAHEYVKNILRMVDLVRLTLTFDKKQIIELGNKFDIAIDNVDVKRIMSIIETMHNDVKTFDYVDMVYQPVIRPKEVFIIPYDYVFLDEAQDLSKAQQAVVKLATKKIGGRSIAVGDKKQSIYSFMGADDSSFDRFKNQPNTTVLPLPISYRCAKNIIKLAQTIVPDIEAYEHAVDGIVRNGSVIDEAKSGDFVLCRTTKPLVKLFFEFLKNNVKSSIKGRDIGLGLIEMIHPKKNLGLNQMLIKIREDLNKYGQTLMTSGIIDLQEHLGYLTVLDKVEVIEFLGQLVTNIDELILKIEDIFKEDCEGIILSTVHKAKGLEADTVFIIRPDKLPLKCKNAWLYQQEMNLKYVAITRARQELVFDVTWTDEEEKPESKEILIKNLNN